MSSVQLSIIIVDYKTTSLVNSQVELFSTQKDWEVIVVDNNTVNRGYGAGLNEGVRKSRGEYLLFLNPDILISPTDIQELVSFIEKHDDVGVVGPQITDTHGNIVPSSLGPLSIQGALVGLSGIRSLFKQNKASSDFWLTDWDRTTMREVMTINGACMCIRRDLFDRLGGFDESYFLYWEENDLCDRVRNCGYRVVFLPKSHARHDREQSMKQSNQYLLGVFMRSRDLYMRKHVGFLKGEGISIFLWLTEQWRAVVLFFIALVPRIHDLGNIFVIDDVRRDYSYAISMLQGKGIPLLGIPSSVPRFSQGPLNIWFDALAFKLGGSTITSPVILAGICTSLGVVSLYFLLHSRVGKDIAFISSLLFALSPAAIAQSRMPFYLFAIPIFILFFLHTLVHLRPTKRSVFMVIFSFCLLFQWELATIPFIAVVAYSFYKNHIRIFSFWKSIGAALFLGLLPQILFDVTHRCQQMCQFVIWMGYRTVAVTGIDGRHALTVFSPEFWSSVIYQVQKMIGLGELGIVLVTTSCVLGSVLILRRRSIPSLFIYAVLSMGALFVGLIIHGTPSEAYFPPFLILFPIVVAYSLQAFNKTIRKR